MGISRETNDDGLRWYEYNGMRAMSVTTVLQFLEEDTTGLEKWKTDNDGTDGSPHHEHIYWYSAPRGTLCHYQALCTFEDAFDMDDDMWGSEESESMQMAMEGPDEDAFDEASHDSSDVVYSILKNKGVVSDREEYEALFEGNTRLVDLIQEDTEYFHDTFKTICDKLGVTDESVIRVEKFMLNDEHRYGGQCDLIYEDENGDIVVADLKTSSGLRQKHRLQAVAYMKGVEQAEWGSDEVDRVEVWRIQPDDKEWQVHTNEVPEHLTHLDDGTESSHVTDKYWFEDKWGDFEYDSIEDMWETFKDLSKQAHTQVED